MAAAPGKEGRTQAEGAKVFLDPIHGHIEVDRLSVKIIDTPQFQRLRNIKQLGGGYWVYPGACHNRFEHSLGVYHLAGCLITEIQSKQPDLKKDWITEKDVLCVKIAGLCHDLGHGPFSHVFDQQFMKQAQPHCTWKHEDASIAMFLDLFKNDVKLEENDIELDENDLIFIGELINPPKHEPGEWPYKGRTEEKKGFLYQIISNAENGMDVDKWDYFARDSHYTGLPKRFDHMRLIRSARVIKVDGKWQICYRKKEWLNVYNMFHTRACLHREVYQHKTKVVVEMMITDALLKADDHMKISACQDTYTMLTDSIFDNILYSEGDKLLKEAREILERVSIRNLYRYIGEIPAKVFKQPDGSEPDTLNQTIAAYCTDKKITAEDIAVNRVNVNYGKGKNNPVDYVRFWTKDNPDEAAKLEKEELSEMLPQKFADKFWRVYCKKKDKESIKEVERCFDVFMMEKKDVTTPQKPTSKEPSPPETPSTAPAQHPGQGARRNITAALQNVSTKQE